MSDLTAKCDWYDGTLSIVLPEDPERIAVRLFDSRYAPARCYVPEADILQLRELCTELLRMAETHDPEWPHWPELHDELRKLGVEVDE